jgi:hypothetical protein
MHALRPAHYAHSEQANSASEPGEAGRVCARGIGRIATAPPLSRWGRKLDEIRLGLQTVVLTDHTFGAGGPGPPAPMPLDGLVCRDNRLHLRAVQSFYLR